MLSHHRADQLHLCYRLGPVHLCARCIGLYPGLALALILGLELHPWPVWLEWAVLFLAPLPAFIDWGISTALGKPERANWVRTLTGFGLGAGMGINLAINTRDLLGTLVMAQFVFFLTAFWMIWLISFSRRAALRRKKLVKRMERPGLEEFVLGQMKGAGESSAETSQEDTKPQIK